MKRIVSLIILSTICGFVFSQNIGLGKWRSHFSFDKLYKVIPADNHIYGQGALGLFCYDDDEKTVSLHTKIENLNDVDISTVAYDFDTKCLAIAYKNSNIDLMINDVVYNISDIKRKEISGDKAIYNISFANKKAYLACGFGIVVIDIARKEIFDVYYLGPNGTYLKIMNAASFALILIANNNIKKLRFMNRAKSCVKG